MGYDFLDERTFSFADLARLTNLAPTNIHALVEHGHFKPQFEQKVGAGGRKEAPTYTGRDVLKLLLIAYLVHYRVDVEKVQEMVGYLDGCIKDFVRRKTEENLVHILYTPVAVFAWRPDGCSVYGLVDNPLKEFRPGGPWCYLTLDLQTLVETQAMRMAEFLRLVSEGVDRDKAALDSAT